MKRRSARLEGKSYNFTPYTTRGNGTAGGSESSREQVCDEEDTEQRVDDNNEVCTDMDDVREEKDYETHRKLRISENQARLASLGLQKTISELRSIILSGKPERRKWTKVDYSSATLRSSNRLKGIPCDILLSLQGEIYDFEKPFSENKKKLKDSAFLCARNGFVSRLSPEAMARCCTSIRRGSLYDDINGVCCHSCSAKHTELVFGEEDIKQCADLDNAKHREQVCGEEDIKQSADLDSNVMCTGAAQIKDGTYGICCHSCRQKKLCDEEDCKHCGNLDVKEPCIGKTECSVCRSSNGVFCRGCLKVRYGEEMDDVRKNKHWMCPHCVEEKGVRPNWICNSSLCLKKRRMVPTTLAIFKAKGLRYESVAHLLMDKLYKAEQRRAGRPIKVSST